MSGDVPAHFFWFYVSSLRAFCPAARWCSGPMMSRSARTMPGRCPVGIGARSSPFGMGGGDRRFSRTPIPMKGDRCALIAVRQRETSVCDRPASVPSVWQGHTGRRHGPGRDETTGDTARDTATGDTTRDTILVTVPRDGPYGTRHHPRHRTPRRAIRHATIISYPMMSGDV